MAKMKIEVLAARVAQTRAFAARPAGRLSAALCRPGVAPRPARQSAQQKPAVAPAAGKIRRHQREARLPAFRRDVFRTDADAVGPADGREVVLFADTFNRAYERENLDAALRVLVAGRLPRPSAKARRQRPAVVLRADLSLGGPCRPCARRARPAGRDLCAVRRARRADRRPGAELSADTARRTAVAALRRDSEEHQRACAVVRGVSGARGRGRPPANCRSVRSPARPCCTAIAIRNRSARSSRSSRCCGWFPTLNVETIESSCCGMAGAFGYGADT